MDRIRFKTQNTNFSRLAGPFLNGSCILNSDADFCKPESISECLLCTLLRFQKIDNTCCQKYKISTLELNRLEMKCCVLSLSVCSGTIGTDFSRV